MENELKIKALELAAQTPGKHDEVVARAHAYHEFLAAPAFAGAKNDKPVGKDDKPVGKDGKGATAGKPATKPAAKPAAAATGGAKAPNGTHTQDEVRDQVRKVLAAPGLGREAVISLFKENGGGAMNFNDLKPEFYDAMFEAAAGELSSGEGGAPAAGANDDLGI